MSTTNPPSTSGDPLEFLGQPRVAQECVIADESDMSAYISDLDNWLDALDMVARDLPSPAPIPEIESDDIAVNLLHIEEMTDQADKDLMAAEDTLEIINMELAELTELADTDPQRAIKLQALIQMTNNNLLPYYANRYSLNDILSKLSALWYRDCLSMGTLSNDIVINALEIIATSDEVMLPSQTAVVLVKAAAADCGKLMSLTRSAAAAQNKHDEFKELYDAHRRTSLRGMHVRSNGAIVAKSIEDKSTEEIKQYIDEEMSIARNFCERNNHTDLALKWKELESRKADIIALQAKGMEYAPYITHCAQVGTKNSSLLQSVNTTGKQLREALLRQVSITATNVRQATLAGLPDDLRQYLSATNDKKRPPSPLEIRAAARLLINGGAGNFTRIIGAHSAVADRFESLKSRGNRYYPAEFEEQMRAFELQTASLDDLLRGVPQIWAGMITRKEVIDGVDPADRQAASVALNGLIQRVMPGFMYAHNEHATIAAQD